MFTTENLRLRSKKNCYNTVEGRFKNYECETVMFG